jgi:V-type H+-transporting ATPase subunit C
MSAGQEFWIVAAPATDNIFSKLTGNSSLTSAEGNGPATFPVVDGGNSLVAGSFDGLVTLTDDLHKADSQLDSIVHRLERQCAEVDPDSKFKVESGSVTDHIKSWKWDEAKYPRSRPVADNLKFLSSTVVKMDEEVRAKMQQYNESKTQRSNISKKDASTLTTRDLVDVLTPSKVSNDDFVFTEHLTTVCIILTRGASVEFLKKYETFTEHVVPMSAKHFTAEDDKDGNEVWRVVLLKAEVDAFKRACRENRYVPRDFEYSKDGYEKLIKQREALDQSCAEQMTKVKNLCMTCWSEAMQAWVHVKAMRVFVECTLRFGQSATFAAYSLAPRNPLKARAALNDILTLSKDMDTAKELADAAAEEGDEYFSYVSVSFTPMAAAKAS